MDQKKAFWDLFFEVLNSGNETLIEKALEITSQLEDERSVIAQLSHAASEFASKPEKIKITQRIIKILEEKALKALPNKDENQKEMEFLRTTK